MHRFSSDYLRLPLSGDIIYLYSDLRSFGADCLTRADQDALCAAVVEPLLESGKTVLTTAFTYTSSGRFEVGNTPTRVGRLNKWMLGCPDAERSEHPMFSYVARGPLSKELMRNVGKSAFGNDSVFERLIGRGCSFLHVGRPVRLGNTALHHVEHICGATYRIHKAFPTEVYRGNDYVGTNYTAFLRRRDVPGEAFQFIFTKSAAMLSDAGLIFELGDNDALTNLSAYSYDDTISLLKTAFENDPTIFIDSDFIQY